jgi:carbon starvation protein
MRFGDIVAGQFGAGGEIVASTFLFSVQCTSYLACVCTKPNCKLEVSTLSLSVLVCFWIGSNAGIKASKDTWFLVLFLYVVIASALPVNILLQPRDYLNSFLLYFGLLAGGVSALIAFKGFDSIPIFTSFSAKVIGGQPSPFWPTVPLVIACGALSGFHALVASGTSSKQLRDEKDSLFVGYGAMLTEGFLSTIVVVSISGFGILALGDKVLSTGALPRFTQSYGAMVNSALPFMTKEFMALFASIWVSSFALTTLDTTNRLGRYIVGEMAFPLKEKSPGLYSMFQNKWIASLIIAFFGIGLAWTGNYTVLWPAFSGANQLIASIVMLTGALWVKKKLNEKYTNIVLIPAMLLWVTVTVALIWYEFVIIPLHFKDMANVKNVTTGVVVGVITLIMLVMNVVMIMQFFKNLNSDKAAE